MWIRLDYLIFRPLLSKVLPTFLLCWWYSFLRKRTHAFLPHKTFEAKVIHEPKVLWQQSFRNRLGVAAGLDKDGSLLSYLYALGAGYVVLGTVLDRPHKGNPGTPWIPLVHSHAAINALGLPSPGIDQMIQNISLFRTKVQPQHFPIGISLMAHPHAKTESEKFQSLKRAYAKAVMVADFIEFNQSCPNVGEDLDHLDVPEELLDTDLPVWLKLQQMPPQDKILNLCAQGKIQGLVISNTVPKMDASKVHEKDRKHLESFQKRHGGGVSGPPLKEKNLHYLSQWKDALASIGAKTRLIGCGGIRNHEDLADYDALCDLSQAYTGVWEAIAHHGNKHAWNHLIQSS